jgi:hypothetical protein
MRGYPQTLIVTHAPRFTPPIASLQFDDCEWVHGRVKTYADRHLHEPGDKLPLTQLRIGSDEIFSISTNISLPSTVVRSALNLTIKRFR